MRSACLALASLLLAGCDLGENQADDIEAAANRAEVATIEAADLAALQEAGAVVLIDVRTPAEFAEARLAGALNAPVETFDPASIPIEEDRETILYCASSRRSGVAAEKLAEHLGTKVRHLEGGIAAWREAGLETIASPADGARAAPAAS